MHSTSTRMAPPPEKTSSMVPSGGSAPGMKAMASSDSTALGAPWRTLCALMPLTRANCSPAGRRFGFASSPVPAAADSQSKRLTSKTSFFSRLKWRMSPTLRRASCIWTEMTARSSASSAPSFNSSIQAPLPRGSTANAFDICPASGELALQGLEAAVEMIDAVQHRLAMGGQSSDDQRDRGPQIGGHHLGSGQLIDAADERSVAVQRDVGPQPRQLLHMHEAVLEDGLANGRYAPRPGHQRHELSLEIGREARIGLRVDVYRIYGIAIAHDAHAARRLRNLDAGHGHGVDEGIEVPAARPVKQDIPAGHRSRHGIGAGFDAIGNDVVNRAGEPVHAFDHQGR